MTYGEMPGNSKEREEMKDAVLHASITIGDTLLMASDVSKDRFQPIRSAYLCLGVDSDAEAERLFKLLQMAARCSCPWMRPFLRLGSGCCEINSERHGWSFTKNRWDRGRKT